MIEDIDYKADREVEIVLTGPQGNAFYLLGLVDKYAKGIESDAKEIQEEMMAGDYENLIHVFDKYFGHFVTMYR